MGQRHIVATWDDTWWIEMKCMFRVHDSYALLLISASSLGVYYFLSWSLSVCPSVCLSQTLLLFFVSRWNLAISSPSVLHDNKKAVLSQRWPRNAPYTWVPWKFRDSLTMPTATIPNIFHGLLFGSILWMFVHNLKSVALSVPEIIGGTPKIWTVPDTPTLPFLQNF